MSNKDLDELIAHDRDGKGTGAVTWAMTSLLLLIAAALVLYGLSTLR